jgi:hypothetical protein
MKKYSYESYNKNNTFDDGIKIIRIDKLVGSNNYNSLLPTPTPKRKLIRLDSSLELVELRDF